MKTIEVAKAAEIPVGEMKLFSVEGKNILVANFEGNFYAMNAKCTHRGGDLSKNKLEGNIVTCPLHGSKFDIMTGKNISGPKLGFLKIKIKDGESYPVSVDNGIVKINI